MPDTENHNGEEIFSLKKISSTIKQVSPEMSFFQVEKIALLLYATPKSRITKSPTVAGRIGLQLNGVSELTVLAPLKEGGAERLRKIFELLHHSFQEAEKVGTLHNMRFVFLDNNTKMLFATAYDGDFDVYINDFATKIPLEMDLIFSSVEGWPGIADPSVKDFIVQHQIQATAWYVNPAQGSVAETVRRGKMVEAADHFLDQVGDGADEKQLLKAFKKFVKQTGTL